MNLDKIAPFVPFHEMEELPLEEFYATFMYDVVNKEDKAYEKCEKDVDTDEELV